MIKHKVKFEVYDNQGILILSNIITVEAEAPTVKDIKKIVNPGTYTNIKTEFFSCDARGNITDNENVTTPFIKYRIDLN
jgi:hypothetical protein